MTPRSPARHFHVPADELLLTEPTACAFLPTLTLDGLAVTDQGQHHLILTLSGLSRFYVGPDDATVDRRAAILTAALSVQQHQLDPFHAALIGDWIRWSWEALLDELVDQLTQGLH